MKPADDPAPAPRGATGRALALDALLAVAVLAPPLAAAMLPVSGPLMLRLNLGPGDAPYVSGFWPRYEIEDRVATHWTRYDAEVALPLEVAGGPLAVSWRYARVLPQTAEVDVALAGSQIDHFTCRGGRVEERRVEVGALPATPLRLRFAVDSHDRQDKGLRLDEVRFEAAETARLRLTGDARWRPAALMAVVLLLLRGLGWSRSGAAALAVPLALGAALALRTDPWLTHRLLRWVPEAVALAGGVGVGVGVLLTRAGRCSPRTLRVLGALALATLVGRSLVVNHPDFYYPDLRTHARLAEILGEARLDFFVDPPRYIAEHGVWRTEAHGRVYAFPYSPAFHLPFAIWRPGFDAVLTGMKLAAAAVSVVPLLLVWALARRLGLSPIGAVLMAVIPTYVSRLSWAFLPALFGHTFDVALLLWLAIHLERLADPRVWARGALWVAAAQLAYVSGTLNTAALIAALAVAASLLGAAPRRPRVLAILAMGVLGAAVALAVYYRSFLPMALDVASRAAGAAGEEAASRHPVQGWLTVIVERTWDFFGALYPLLALAGLVALWRRRSPALVLLLGWLGAYLLLLLGRARVPDVFAHGHETLLITPFVCLVAGESLASLARRGRGPRAVAVGVGVILGVRGLWLQWEAMAAQLGNAL